MAYSKYKIIRTGHVIEVYEYEKPVPYGLGKQRPESDSNDELDWSVEPAEAVLEPEPYATLEELIKRRSANQRRTRNMIRRLCLANFNEHSKFVTLTFADGSIEDVTDITLANKAFDRFIKRLRRRYGSFRYIAVIEFQDKNGRGAVHYHMMSDLPYIPNADLSKIWRNGFVKINDIQHVDNVGAYMVKYMTKDVHDNRLAGRKAYLTSQNLERPIVLRGEDAFELISYLAEKEKVFTGCYPSEHFGQITYSEYNLRRGNSIPHDL